MVTVMQKALTPQALEQHLTGHDADAAESFGLTKLDAGVCLGAVRVEDLADAQTVQLVAQGWPGA